MNFRTAILSLAVALPFGAAADDEGIKNPLSDETALKKAASRVAALGGSKTNLKRQKKEVKEELLELADLAHEAREKYAHGNSTDDRFLRALSGDCTATSDGGVKCCQVGEKSGRNICITYYCPVRGEVTDACRCKVEIDGTQCNSCVFCNGGEDMDYDCNNYARGLENDVCPDAKTTTPPPQKNQGDDDENKCHKASDGGVECCSTTDKGTNYCMTFYCSGGTVTGDCRCKFAIEGRACRECDVCPGGEDFYFDCTNLGSSSAKLEECSDKGGSGGSSGGGGGGGGSGIPSFTWGNNPTSSNGSSPAGSLEAAGLAIAAVALGGVIINSA